MVSARLPVSWLPTFSVACLAEIVAIVYPVLPSLGQLLSWRGTTLRAWLTGSTITVMGRLAGLPPSRTPPPRPSASTRASTTVDVP